MYKFLCRRRDKTSGSLANLVTGHGALEWLEAELVDGDAKGGEFRLVRAQKIIVRLAHTCQLVLKLIK